MPSALLRRGNQPVIDAADGTAVTAKLLVRALTSCRGCSFSSNGTGSDGLEKPEETLAKACADSPLRGLYAYTRVLVLYEAH